MDRSLFFVSNYWDLQMFLSKINTVLVIQIIDLTLASVPSCLSIMLSRYVKILSLLAQFYQGLLDLHKAFSFS